MTPDKHERNNNLIALGLIFFCGMSIGYSLATKDEEEVKVDHGRSD